MSDRRVSQGDTTDGENKTFKVPQEGLLIDFINGEQVRLSFLFFLILFILYVNVKSWTSSVLKTYEREVSQGSRYRIRQKDIDPYN